MMYSYDRLWKRLTDKNITNSEISRMANINAHTLSKMQKNEPITLDNLAKIATVLNCSFDDIIEFSDEMYGISNATMRNWKKLNTNSSDRLTSRANKRKSPKRILPYEYFSNEGNIPFTQKILDIIDSQSLDILPSIFSLGINLLKKAGLYNKSHVSAVLADYSDITVIPELEAIDIPDDEYDILGLIYQSYQREGEKNIAGSYYTPQQVAYNMTCSFNFSNHQKFLDPCCGSGAFLLSVPAKTPLQIFGIDNDETAVLIAKITLLLKYSKYEFNPQIYCFDYLSNDTNALRSSILNTEFDYIATNPPWGAMGHNNVISNGITSEESFSLFFVKSFEQLKANGTIRFLFPESILNVKAHKDIRQYILENTKLVSITKYNDVFSGVTTNYIDIECINASKSDHFMVYSGTETRSVSVSSIYETDNLIFNLLSDDDISIIHKIKDKGNYYLKNSTWALGIVTGDNKNKLLSEPNKDTERIYTGKEIQPYILKPAKKYIVYDRNQLQQVAKDDIYRAPEKLVYKFISNKLVFAYDDSSSLFLNSANILIPDIPNMSIKAVMAFLNSALFQFLYNKLFGEIKILKGNLMELPFPQITSTDNNIITALVDDILSGNTDTQNDIDKYIFSLYNLTDNQISHIRSEINGTAD